MTCWLRSKLCQVCVTNNNVVTVLRTKHDAIIPSQHCEPSLEASRTCQRIVGEKIVIWIHSIY